eukprot:GHVT01088255.1.p1 GENE.GHVT01088255.1~~GHVT01088255.1.p1  ORF type:complete len:325 (+),score=62.40 GHVT01088255.1:1139-2113(+)
MSSSASVTSFSPKSSSSSSSYSASSSSSLGDCEKAMLTVVRRRYPDASRSVLQSAIRRFCISRSVSGRFISIDDIDRLEVFIEEENKRVGKDVGGPGAKAKGGSQRAPDKKSSGRRSTSVVEALREILHPKQSSATLRHGSLPPGVKSSAAQSNSQSQPLARPVCDTFTGGDIAGPNKQRAKPKQFKSSSPRSSCSSASSNQSITVAPQRVGISRRQQCVQKLRPAVDVWAAMDAYERSQWEQSKQSLCQKQHDQSTSYAQQLRNQIADKTNAQLQRRNKQLQEEQHVVEKEARRLREESMAEAAVAERRRSELRAVKKKFKWQ